jgi:hypothetical protein
MTPAALLDAIDAAARILDAQPVPQAGRMFWDPKTATLHPQPPEPQPEDPTP